MTGYRFSLEGFTDTYKVALPLYQQHYSEMCERLTRDGFKCSPFNPRLDQYFEAENRGDLLTFIAWHGTDAVGYMNVYVTNDMHNHDKIAHEDALFILKEHRNGLGRKFVQFGLAELKRRGVKRLFVEAVTDLRVAKLWSRMGFKERAIQMTYDF